MNSLFVWVYFLIFAIVGWDWVLGTKTLSKDKFEASPWERFLALENQTHFTSSYLWSQHDIDTNPKISFLNKLVKVIHAVQRPPKQVCKARRLLVLQMRSTSFEGTGSLIKQILLGLAIAVHSHRTLVWGLGLPYIFEHSQELWAGEKKHRVIVGNDEFDCRSDDPAGGAFGCLLEPMASCSLADASASDILAYSLNAHNDTARLQVAEVSKRGVALYHPPEGLFDFILAHQRKKDSWLTGGALVSNEDIVGLESHFWVAAVAAYFFRLKPNVAKTFSRRALSSLGNGKAIPRPVWGLHVRHGDLKANPDLYRYKTVFDFEEYFAAARDLTHLNRVLPKKLFVSTDSKAADAIEDQFKRFNAAAPKAKSNEARELERRIVDAYGIKAAGSQYGKKVIEDLDGRETDEYEYYDEEEVEEENTDTGDDHGFSNMNVPLVPTLSLVVRNSRNISEMKVRKYEPIFNYWFNDNLPQSSKLPAIAAIPNEFRYRTEHGSHTVAANGGCQKDENYDKKGMRCALEFDVIMKYQSDEEHLSIPRYFRIFRVFVESMEDIYLLSQADVLVGQGSSYYSTLATYLLWARSGCHDALNSVLYLDQGHISAGITPTAHLHGMNIVNSTFGYDPKVVPNAGEERWKIHSKNFISALEKYSNVRVANDAYGPPNKLGYNPWHPSNFMKIVDLLPKLPDKIFYHEARSWLLSPYEAVWPGSCPSVPLRSLGTKTEAFVSTVANLGHEMHEAVQVGQSAHCWMTAKKVIIAFTAKNSGSLSPQQRKFYDEALDVVTGNLKSLLQMSYADLVINEAIEPDDAKSFRNRKAALMPPGFLSGEKLLLSNENTDAPEASYVAGSCQCDAGKDSSSIDEALPTIPDCVAKISNIVAATDETIGANIMDLEESMGIVDGLIDDLYAQLDKLHSIRGRLLLAKKSRR